MGHSVVRVDDIEGSVAIGWRRGSYEARGPF
jgi:hypothetical protein